VLSARIDGDDLVVAYRGTEHRLPRIVMPAPDGLWYDCVSVYSLTEPLHADYRIFVRTPWREDATDRLLVVPVEQAQAWRSLPKHLTPLGDLEVGYAYFSRVTPDWEAEPDAATESDAARTVSDGMSRLIAEAFISGKADAAACAALAKVIMADPELSADLPEGSSEASIAAQLEGVVQEALQDPEVQESRSEYDDAMQELWKLTGGPPKEPS
jgi:hypothetical protein